jgi:hypothetical protein
MKNIWFNSILLAVACVLLMGCSIKYTSSRVMPSAAISPEKTYFVILNEEDERHIDLTLAEEMRAMGLTNVASGPEKDMPADTDVIVLFEDRWMWDITNYLLMFKVQFRDATNNILIARGQSVRTSLARKSVQVMVQEALMGIFRTEAEEV